VRNTHDTGSAMPRDYAILSRMLADADDLCGTQDALLAGQYRHLRGRIAALLDLVAPLGNAEDAS
jgi:hypothetical protein